MNMSFEEKSVWVEFVSYFIGLGGYLVVAGRMLSNGVSALTPFVPIFAVAVVFIVAVNIVGHIVAAATSRSDEADERDRLIGWRAESGSSWILGFGVIGAITALIFSVGSVWVAHLLLISLFVSEVTKNVLQIVYYRRGI